MILAALIEPLVGARVIGDAGVAVRAVRADSRLVEPGDVYVAVRGMRADGHAFVAAAIERGAAAVVVEQAQDVAVPQVIVADGARALGRLVGRALGDPAQAMTLIGITGTNGKTTTTYLLESILAAAGARPGVIGTVEYRSAGHNGARALRVDASYTTPTPQILHETFAALRDAGCTHVVMEVSSVALSTARMAGVTFQVAAFSNLTQDHLDVHGSMAAYRDAKRLLFADHLAGPAVVNVDDPEAEGMAALAPGRVVRVSAAGAPADVRVTGHDSTVRGIRAELATPRGALAVASAPLIGHYNVANLALAVGVAEALDLPHDAIARGVAALPGVPGRVERVANAAGLDIFVDYAHTPDALHNVLSALRPLTRGRLICVFGCGGDRDPTKRPRMGAEVAALADLAVVTSDNPRTEDPRAILDEILAGVPRPFAVDVDRARAIRAAISEAVPGDVVVIAGKGHEDYQILGTTKHHFDDREHAAEAVAERQRSELRALDELARDAGAVDTWRAATAAPMAAPTGAPMAAPTAAPVPAPPAAPMSSPVPAPPAAPGAPAIHRVVIDSRLAAPGDLYVAIRGERLDGHQFCRPALDAGAAVMIDQRFAEEAARGPGGAAALAPAIVVDDTRRAIGALAHAHRARWPGTLVAITGSAGKTTTKELTRSALALAAPTHAAEGSLNNETGVPLTLLGLRDFHRYGVVEMGMRGAGQIEYLTKLAEPDVAVVINAGTAHIELLGSPEAIAAAKAEIWLGLRPGGTVVRPLDDDRLAGHARRHRPDARHLTFGGPGADVALVDYRPTDGGAALTLEVLGARHALALGLLGRHAAIDACAALAAALAAGAPIDQALRGLSRARPPALRGEIVEVAGRHVIVDCYNANPASMAAALRAVAERAYAEGHGHGHGQTAVAVLGDMLELGDHGPAAHREIGELARELHVGVVAIGELGAVIARCAGGEHAGSPDDAAASALARTQPGDWILLKASRGMRLERVLAALSAAKQEP